MRETIMKWAAIIFLILLVIFCIVLFFWGRKRVNPEKKE